MKRTIINNLYSGGTRGARVLNLSLHSVWVIALILHFTELLEVQIPRGLGGEIHLVLAMAIVTVGLSALSFLGGRFRSLFKCLSLHSGALTQAWIFGGLTMDYPPLEIQSVTAFMFSLWLLGAAYFVIEKECVCKGVTNACLDNAGSHDQHPH